LEWRQHDSAAVRNSQQGLIFFTKPSFLVVALDLESAWWERLRGMLFVVVSTTQWVFIPIGRASKKLKVLPNSCKQHCVVRDLLIFEYLFSLFPYLNDES
jgi:hypothetical protein